MTISASPVLEEALEWTARGHFVVPIPAGLKYPREKGWQNLRLTMPEVSDRFSDEGIGLGLLLGVSGLVDVDLDCREARALGPLILPATGLIHGRESAPSSHWWYLCERTPRTAKVEDPALKDVDQDRAMILEVRSTGGQTVIPPSTHPSGEPIRYDAAGEPASVPAELLMESANLLAACVLATRGWPGKGGRHQAALHLAGVLVRRRLDEDEVADIVERVAHLAGDEEARKRRQDAIDTCRRFEAGEPTSGLPQLLEELRLDEKQARRLGDLAGTRETFPVIPHRGKQRAAPIVGLADTTEPGPALNGDRPMLHVGEQDLAKVTPEAWEAIRLANDPPRLFRYGETAVRLQRNEAGAPILMELSEDRLRHELARAAHCYKIDRMGNTQAARPPKDVVADMLAVPEPPLPALTRIVEAPVFAADGRLQTEPGYHEASKTFYAAPRNVRIPSVSQAPTVEEMAAARALVLEDLYADFPFVGRADRAGAVALFLAPYCRDFIPGPTPNHLIEAPEAGSGKTLLAEAALSAAIGRNIGGITEARDDDEWRKRITAQLREGTPVVLIDNVRRSLDSGALASALTQLEWRDRILGRTEIVRFPIRCLWVTTANNPSMTTEMARRCVRIRLDAKRDQPWRRPLDGFRHPDLRTWIAEHRGRLIWAALTLVRGWIAVGKPEGSARPLGSFEEWTQTIGGILHTAGIPGFLENLDELYAEVDAQGAVWRTFIGLWWQKLADRVVGVADLFPLTEEVEGLPLSGSTDRGLKTSFGRQLNAQRGRIIAGYRVTPAGTAQRAALWQLQRADQ